MRRIATVALIVVWGLLSACAQRTAPRSGASYHTPSTAHGGFNGSALSRSGSASGRFAGTPHFPAGSFSNGVHASQRGVREHSGARPPYPDSRHRRMPYRGEYRRGYSYGYLGYPGLVSPFLLGNPGSYYNAYPDSSSNDDGQVAPDYAQAPPDDASEEYDAQQADQGQPMPPAPSSRSTYRPPSSQPSAAQAPVQPGEQLVTLVFKDGRPREQIHNYILTRTALYVLDQDHRQIPIDEFDLAATKKANQDSGVDFELPGASR